MGRLRWSRQAQSDILDIGRYIAERSQSWKTADTFLMRIERDCTTYARSPELGQRRPEFGDGEYRCFPVGNYVVYYRQSEDGIIIARVLHGARDHDSLL